MSIIKIFFEELLLDIYYLFYLVLYYQDNSTPKFSKNPKPQKKTKQIK
jgi:hypothetical protein